MRKSPDWAEEYFLRQDEEIRKLILDSIEGKISCHIFGDTAALVLAEALPFLYL